MSFNKLYLYKLSYSQRVSYSNAFIVKLSNEKLSFHKITLNRLSFWPNVLDGNVFLQIACVFQQSSSGLRGVTFCHQLMWWLSPSLLTPMQSSGRRSYLTFSLTRRLLTPLLPFCVLICIGYTLSPFPSLCLAYSHTQKHAHTRTHTQIHTQHT